MEYGTPQQNRTGKFFFEKRNDQSSVESLSQRKKQSVEQMLLRTETTQATTSSSKKNKFIRGDYYLGKREGNTQPQEDERRAPFHQTARSALRMSRTSKWETFGSKKSLNPEAQ